MKTYKTLVTEADAVRRNASGKNIGEIRRALAEALAREYPAVARAAVAARATGAGKKYIVAQAAAALMDLADPAVAEALDLLARAGSWREAREASAPLGLAGELIMDPAARGLDLPGAPCSIPTSWGTNWGMPNAQAVAGMLLRRCPSLPRRGNGWEFIPA